MNGASGVTAAPRSKRSEPPQHWDNRGGALAPAAHFVRASWPRLLLISALALLPCFWHSRIHAGDLGSHLYNTWLAQLSQAGQAPGIIVVPQWTNVLFDWSLSGLGALLDLEVAEAISVSVVVLTFFWALFALVCAAAGRAVWWLLPCVAMLTYGWTFHAGLMNYYISVALALLGLAIFWRGRRWERLAVLALSPVAMLAHPAGPVWLWGAAACIIYLETAPPRYRFALPVAAAAVLLSLRFYLTSRFRIENPPLENYLINGTDQMALFGQRYQFIAGAILALGLACFIVDLVERRRAGGFVPAHDTSVLLYVCAQIGILILPAAVHVPRYAAPFSMIQERLSLLSAALACCVLAGLVRPRRWQIAGFSVLALLFFGFLYADTGALNRIESRAAELVRTLPPNQRVLTSLEPGPGWRPYALNHVLSRACIGHCFAYGNYEPSSGQFRVRAEPGNSIVLTSYWDTEATERGIYPVSPSDLPVFQLYQCNAANWEELCIRPLDAGETNNRLGLHPEGLPH